MTLLKAVCIDCGDPWRLAHWWAPVLGYRVRQHTEEDRAELRERGIQRVEDDPEIALDPLEGSGPTIWFNKVPEEKAAKNRVHLDVYGDVDELVARGGVVLYRTGELPGTSWAILADPEGNEFCVFQPT
jgi:hypothetical protein